MQNNTSNSKKIKVLVLSHISDLLGGAERSMLDVFDHWAANYNIEPEFILREPLKSLAPALEKRGWKYYALNYTFWSDGRPPVHPQQILHNAAHNARAVQAIEEIIAKSMPDVVITNSIVCPWAALAAQYARVPHVWFVREYGDLDHGRVFEIGREKTWQDVGNLSDLVVTISKSLAEHAAQYIDKDKIAILYNPFKFDEIRQKAAVKIKPPFTSQTSLKAIISGNLAPTKGQLEAVEAVGRLNAEGLETELCLVGAPGEKDYMKRIGQAIGRYKLAGKVHLTGFSTDLPAYVALADVGIMASRREGFGRVTFEYLVLGKPVVGADSGATPEMVLDGKTGYLFEAGKVESLAAALRHYARDKSLAKAHGQNAEKHAEEMMRGQNSAAALFEKVQAIAAKGTTTTPQPINFTHRWLEYAGLAGKTDDTSIRSLVKIRLRQKAKPAYVKLRNLKTKLTGK